MDKRKKCKNKENTKQDVDCLRDEIKENYKIGVEYFEDIEEHQDKK